MYINVIERKKPVWWAWGDGGYHIEQGPNGVYPVSVPPVVAGQLNNPQPHWMEFEKQLSEMPKDFSGWVLKHHAAVSNLKLQRGVVIDEFDLVYFFLRRLEDVTESRVVIRIDNEQLGAMRHARRLFRDLTAEQDDEAKTPMMISEIALYDEGVNFIGSINPLHAIYTGSDSLEIVIDTRSQAEIDASNAAWERTEREREARGALM